MGTNIKSMTPALGPSGTSVAFLYLAYLGGIFMINSLIAIDLLFVIVVTCSIWMIIIAHRVVMRIK